MSLNYDRYCRLIVAGQSGSGYDLSAMRIHFTIEYKMVTQPAKLEARIYNLSKSTATAIKAMEEGGFVQLEAGYQDNHGIIFKGNAKWVNIGRENPTDTYVDVFAGDGDMAFNFATVSKTFAAGSKPQDHWNEIMTQLGKYGVTPGLISFVDLSTPVYPRAVTLFGMAAEALRTLAKSKNASAYINQGQVNLTDKKHGPQV